MVGKNSRASKYGTGVQLVKNVLNANKPYRALISINGKNTFLGYFETPEEAQKAYQTKKEQIQKQPMIENATQTK
jgi:hypothetical protein